MARDRKLSAEDRILWGRVARSARPMPGRLDEIAAFDELIAAQEAEAQALAAKAKEQAAAADAATVVPQKLPSGRHHPFERPVKRKIAKGQLPLEARIDLHGLVQSEAHAMLLDFLIRAHGRGLRHVLVITGKGSSMGSEGALKRAVPLWFSKPEFRYLISSYESAAQHHGGEGALYIRMVRQRAEKA
jgi:DNA-nicking Smr family endonuclease